MMPSKVSASVGQDKQRGASRCGWEAAMPAGVKTAADGPINTVRRVSAITRQHERNSAKMFIRDVIENRFEDDGKMI